MKHLFTLTSLLFAIFLFPPSSYAQLALEKDINTQAASSEPSELVELDGYIYFSADDGIHGTELFRYNIENGTHELLVDLRPNDDSSSPVFITAFDGKIFLRAREGNGTIAFLMVYNPADNTLTRFRDANSISYRDPSNLYVFNNQLFFTVSFLDKGVEPVRYDPATNEVKLVADINPNGNSSPSFFTEANGKLWFSANDGESGSRLWQYDPVTDTVSNIIYQSTENISANLNFLYHAYDKLFFRGFISGKGDEFYVYDIPGNKILDIPELYPGPGSSSPSGFVAFDGKVYFAARTQANGREVMVYDPGDNSVSLAFDINPTGNGNPGILHPIGNTLYTTADDGISGERKVYALKAGSTQFDVVAGLANDGNPNLLNILIGVGNELYLYGKTPETGTELFVYTHEDDTIKVAADINQNTIGSMPYYFTPYNGRLYFGAQEPVSGSEIWVYDPATGQTKVLPGAKGNTKPWGFTVVKNKLYFAGIDPGLGYGLLQYDDQKGEVLPTSYITPNNTGHIESLIAYNDKLYFTARDDSAGKELFVYDPDTDAASLLKDINPDGSSNPSSLFLFDNKLFFGADDGVSGNELWVYDAVSDEVKQVADINPGEGSSSPDWFASYKGELYFSAYKPESNYDVYSYNPTTGTVSQRSDISGNLNPEFLTVYMEKLFFKGNYESRTGVELLYYDVSTNSVELAADINPSGSSNPSWLTVYNDKLYFSATTKNYGTELWEYTTDGAAIIADIRSGVPGSSPEWLTVFNDKLYFAADDGQRGSEIWSLASCLNLFVTTKAVYHTDSLGSISLSIEGGTPPYTVLWSNGSDDVNLEGLEPGEYTVTVSDATGCLSELIVEVEFFDTTDAPFISSEPSFTVYPNPGSGLFTIRFKGILRDATNLSVFDMQGKAVLQKTIPQNALEVPLNLSGLQAGIYFIKVNAEESITYKKIFVR